MTTSPIAAPPVHAGLSLNDERVALDKEALKRSYDQIYEI